MGAEFTGLSVDTLATCTARVKIPMAIGVDSLNVGVAAGVFLSRLTER
jgi:tRNA G18 (ribose-2'-O)-methylase SpoU